MQDVVDTTFVINLQKDETKLQEMSLGLAALGIPFQRLAAVQGSEVKRGVSVCSALCTNGMLGCFYSHLKAWQLVKDRGLKRALILEDDVKLHPGSVSKIRECMQELPPDWDILYLGCHSCGKSSLHDMGLAAILGSRVTETRHSANLIRPGLASGTYAYIVSNRGAQKLLRLLPKPSNHVDLAISSLGSELQLFAIDPPVVTHVYDNSSIASKTPVLLNSLTAWNLPGDRRPVNWSLSEPLCRLGNDGFQLNGWAFLFLMTGCLLTYNHKSIYPVLLYLALDYMLLSKNAKLVSNYVVLGVVACMGAALGAWFRK